MKTTGKKLKKHNIHSRGSFELMAEVNTRLVLNALRQHGILSRAELSRLTALQAATVGNVVAGLISKHLVTETKTEKSPTNGAGRPGTLLKLQESSRLVLAIDLEPDYLRCALLNINLEAVAYSEVGINRFAHSDDIMSQIVSSCNSLISINPLWSNKIIGIGVSLPGEVDVENGISCGSTNMPNWKNVPILSHLSDSLHFPVTIGKSYHLAALSEKWRRPEAIDRNIMCISLRTGIGLALLIKGTLYQGASHFDGEIGHTVVELNGNLCECGKRGCLETFLASHAIEKRAKDLAAAGKADALLQAAKSDMANIKTSLIYQLAKAGNPTCAGIVRETSRYLGLAAANLVQVLNPHEVVICGGIDIADDILLQEMDAVFTEMLLPKTRQDVKLLLSPYKEKASLFGAGVVVLDDLFAMPNLDFPATMKSRLGKNTQAK